MKGHNFILWRINLHIFDEILMHKSPQSTVITFIPNHAYFQVYYFQSCKVLM